MTVERQIDYEMLAQDAMRGVVRTILTRVAEHGLPGEHHFYISFNTLAPGVSIAPRLLSKYPNEMTIVLQHRFWDLHVQQDRFEVKLTFDSIRERLVIPFSAVRVFFDPSVPYGMQFEETSPGGRHAAQAEARHANMADVMGFANGRAGAKSGTKPPADRKKTSRKTKSDAPSDITEAPMAEAEATSRPAAAPAKSETASASATAKTGPRLVESANDGAKVVSLDQFRKK